MNESMVFNYEVQDVIIWVFALDLIYEQTYFIKIGCLFLKTMNDVFYYLDKEF